MPPPPVDASTVILMRSTASDGFEVLLQRRHRGMAFVGGAYVFPGGKVDLGDTLTPPQVAPDSGETCRARLAPADGLGETPTPERALSWYVAAAREMFEEAGVLLASHKDSPVASDAERWSRVDASRARVLAGDLTVRDVLLAESLSLDLEALIPWAHWITPSAEPRRYDTRFFVAELPQGQEASPDNAEAVEQAWMEPAAALEAYHAGEIVLPPPTYINLRQLAAVGDEGVANFARSRAIAPILPKISQDGDDLAILLPWDGEYVSTQGEALDFPGARHPDAEEPSRVVMREGQWSLERR